MDWGADWNYWFIGYLTKLFTLFELHIAKWEEKVMVNYHFHKELEGNNRNQLRHAGLRLEKQRVKKGLNQDIH
jgi:hypothetical protein